MIKYFKKLFYSILSTDKKIIILIISFCVIIGCLTPTINSVIVEDNNGFLEEKKNKEPEFKQTDIDENVIAYASFYWKPKYPDPGEEISFHSRSFARNGYIHSEIWKFEDGTTFRGGNCKYTFENKGSYKVVLTVTAVGYRFDSSFDSEIHYVNVGADPFPKITIVPPKPLPGEDVKIDGSQSFDPDGEIISYNWSFYNEKNPNDIIYLGKEKTIYHKWENQGIYHIILNIIDDKGNNNTLEKVIHVSILTIEGIDKFSRKINFEITNHGTFTANKIKWNLEVKKYTFLGLKSRPMYQKNGYTSNLEPDESEDVTIRNLRRSFCKIKLNVSAEAENAVIVRKSFYGLTFGKFIFLSENDFINPYTFVPSIFFILSLIILILSIFTFP